MARCWGVFTALVMAGAHLSACGDDGGGGGGGGSGGTGGKVDAGGKDSGANDSSVQDSTASDSNEKDSTTSDAPASDGLPDDATSVPDADAGGPVENCANGQDDDGDQDIDCADSQCASSSLCGELEKCGDAVDNDSDGFDDCKDSECSCATSCGGPACPSGVAELGTSAVNMPNTAGACHAYVSTCSPTASPERTLSFTAPTASGARRRACQVASGPRAAHRPLVV